MSVDVTTVNRIRANTQPIAANTVSLSNTLTGITSSINEVRFNGRRAGDYTPIDANSWVCIPALVNPTGTILVCATDGTYWRCGASCTFTVPAGTTRVRFELWGPGGGTGSTCCCGVVPFGMTGAYASVILCNVPAGCAYTVCAGCSVCCYVARTTMNAEGGASYVTGYGLCNLCARGGSANMCVRMLEYNEHCWPGPPQLFSDQYKSWDCCCLNIGACLCNSGSDTCINGYASCGIIPMMYSRQVTYFGHTTCAVGGAKVCGVPGIHSEVCWDANFCGYTRHAPVPGFANTTQCVVCWGASSYANSGHLSSAWCQDYLRVPGAGGAPAISKGGTNTFCGDSGRFGMVRITYC